MTKHYLLVEVEGDPNAHEWLRAILAYEPVRTADVTDLVVTEQRNFDSDRYPEEWNYSLLDAVDKLA